MKYEDLKTLQMVASNCNLPKVQRGMIEQIIERRKRELNAGFDITKIIKTECGRQDGCEYCLFECKGDFAPCYYSEDEVYGFIEKGLIKLKDE